MNKNTLSHTLRTISASIMLLFISISILPLNLFHHHHSSTSDYCENSFGHVEQPLGEKETVSYTILTESEYKDCLFCNWQMGAKLTYVIPEIIVFLPDFVKSKLSEYHLTSVEILAFTDIPNKGPPAFLLF